MTRQFFHEKTGLSWLWLSAIVVALDQITKWYIAENFELFEILPVGPFLDITRIHNEGAAFGLLAQAGGWQRWFFLGPRGLDRDLDRLVAAHAAGPGPLLADDRPRADPRRRARQCL